MQRQKTTSAWKQFCHFVYSCVNVNMLNALTSLFNWGFWISYKYMTFNCVIDLSKFLQYVTYGSSFLWIQIFSWCPILSDNIHKVWDPLIKGTMFANSLICQPLIPRTAFFTTKLTFNFILYLCSQKCLTRAFYKTCSWWTKTSIIPLLIFYGTIKPLQAKSKQKDRHPVD